MVGTYTFVFNFPGQLVTGVGAIIPIPLNSYYQPSNFKATLTVQQAANNPVTSNSSSEIDLLDQGLYMLKTNCGPQFRETGLE